MSLLTNFDTTVNFWELYPQLRIPKAFAELDKKDKSKGHNDSSQIMRTASLFPNSIKFFLRFDSSYIIKANINIILDASISVTTILSIALIAPIS